MKNKKFCIKIRAWVWEYSDENFEKSKLQKEIKKLLTSLDEYAILNKLSREELLHNSKKEIKKVVDKHETLWYNIKAVAWNGNNKKNIDNWTIDNKPWKFFKEIFQERTSKDVEPEQWTGTELPSDSDPDTNIFNESLILAQDERWRRA